jgi:hypothetical protein
MNRVHVHLTPRTIDVHIQRHSLNGDVHAPGNRDFEVDGTRESHTPITADFDVDGIPPLVDLDEPGAGVIGVDLDSMSVPGPDHYLPPEALQGEA